MTRLRRLACHGSLLLVLPALVQAHPGHDGHELTWDFGHLAAHPLATLECFVIIGAGVWCVRAIARRCGLLGPLAVRHDESDRAG